LFNILLWLKELVVSAR